MTEELIIREIRIDEAAWFTDDEFHGHYATSTPII